MCSANGSASMSARTRALSVCPSSSRCSLSSCFTCGARPSYRCSTTVPTRLHSIGTSTYYIVSVLLCCMCIVIRTRITVVQTRSAIASPRLAPHSILEPRPRHTSPRGLLSASVNASKHSLSYKVQFN